MATDTLLTGEILQKAFDALDEALPGPVDLVVGGGTAMMLAYRIPVRTTDVDAYPVKMTPSELDPYVKQVARKQKLPGDWLNPHYATFAHVLPPGYSGRLRDVFVGKKLRARALGPEDLLVMKCFAGRAKDVAHARALLKLKPDLALVEAHIESLMEKRVPRAQEALDFLDDLREQLE
jgi:hypothetical protein